MRIIFVSCTVLTIGYVNSRNVFWTSNQKNDATVKVEKRLQTLCNAINEILSLNRMLIFNDF